MELIGMALVMERFSRKSGGAMRFVKHLKKLGYNVAVRIFKCVVTKARQFKAKNLKCMHCYVFLSDESKLT